MFESTNNHLLHREAIDLVVSALPNSVCIDALAGYDSPYHVEWAGLKFLVKVARPSKKASQDRAKWFYALRENDHKAADFFIFFCLIESQVEAVYAIPRPFVPRVYVTITRLGRNMRYDYFRTTVQDLASKIQEVKAKMPKLAKIFKEVKKLEKSEC